jgi:hypothetical protein
MNLFPNSICVMQSDHLETYRVFPVAGSVNQAQVEISVLAPPGVPGNVSHKSNAHAAAKTTPKNHMAILIRRFAVIGERPQLVFEHDELCWRRMKEPCP